jgi:hypothetical protein
MEEGREGKDGRRKMEDGSRVDLSKKVRPIGISSS